MEFDGVGRLQRFFALLRMTMEFQAKVLKAN